MGYWCGNDDCYEDCETCVRETADYQRGLEDEHRRELEIGLRRALVERCKGADPWYIRFGRIARWFYVFKVFICAALDRREPRTPSGDPWHRRETLEVATISVDHHYSGWNSSVLEVGVGVFRNWWYRIEHDGECTM